MSAPIACLLVLLAAGCGSSSSSTGASGPSPSPAVASPTTTPRYAAPERSARVASGTVQIAYRNIAIAPAAVRVKVGTTVRWTNYDSIEHNVTSEEGPQQFASSDFGEGASFSVKLTKPGLIHYQCTIHPASMSGTIEVLK